MLGSNELVRVAPPVETLGACAKFHKVAGWSVGAGFYETRYIHNGRWRVYRTRKLTDKHRELRDNPISQGVTMRCVYERIIND